ncbi:MAG: hypothetical protein V4641_09835 [Pseudomonadota bacterium]
MDQTPTTNSEDTPSHQILEQMLEPRPLPMGRKEFEAWSDRIISGALIPGATPVSLKFALAEMIMHLKPTDSHCPDAHFIHCLRKGAANQVAWAVMEELRAERKAALAAEEEAAKLKLVMTGGTTTP